MKANMSDQVRTFSRRAVMFMLGAGAASWLGRANAQESQLTDAAGTITAVNASQGWFAIVPDRDQSIRYAPDALAEEFRKDGLRVVFSGRVGAVDPNARAWGIPLALAKIRVE
jgi:hypothetical protein